MPESLTQNQDDAVRWWEAYCLAENDEVDGLQRRADGGDDHARRQLASWLGERGKAQQAAEVIRPLADAGDDIAGLRLARGWRGVARSTNCGSVPTPGTSTPSSN